MSSEEDDQQVCIVKKKYKLWKDDDANPIPLRTLQRWDSHTSSNVPSINRNEENDEADDQDVAATSHANLDNSDKEITCVVDLGDDSNISSNASADMEANLDNSDSEINYNSDSSNVVNLRNVSAVSRNAWADMDTDSNVLTNVNRISGDESDNENDFETVYSNAEDSAGSDDNDSNLRDNGITKLLYEGSTMSTDNCVLALLELYIHHKWTKASLKDTLKLLHSILPEDNEMPKSIHKLFQYVLNFTAPINFMKHFYCRKCVYYNGIDSKIEKCRECGADRKNISFFFEIDVCQQIKHLFENRNLADKLKLRSIRDDGNIISDITDGSEYIRVNSRNNKQRYDLTLILNTDDLALVASSKSHCWPLTFVIAELPEHLRESFLMTIGIWYDDTCKPSMNTFLQPFCSKLRECFYNGISWVHPRTQETIVSRIVAPLIIADAPARAQIQNIHNFNGRYGSNICEIKMQRAQRREGKRNTRIYPYNNEPSRLRSGMRMQMQAQQVLNLNVDHIKGVKGNSVITDLPLLDIGTCLLPEYVHSVLLGVVRQFVNLWITQQGPWSIKHDLEEIDRFLLNIQPPHFFKRLPRRLSLSKFYKASEYYNFMMFYSLPALVNYLPHEYLQHWVLLVKALFILLQDRIRKSPDLEQAEILLNVFVKQTKHLYGDRALSYNLHQLLHLVLIVRRWGPLWATSAFPFENFNGFLANCVHGTKHIGQEIVNNLRIAQGVQSLRYRVTDQNATHTSSDESKTHLVGTSVVMKFENNEIELLASNNLNSENVCVYARAKINNESYTSKIYKTTKTNSYTVQINCIDNSVIYGSIRFFFQIERQTLVFVLNCFTVEHTKIFHNSETTVQVDHIVPVKEANTLFLIKFNHIKSMYHLIRVGDYVCNRPNLFKKVF